jgi:hypothetical protein
LRDVGVDIKDVVLIAPKELNEPSLQSGRLYGVAAMAN